MMRKMTHEGRLVARDGGFLWTKFRETKLYWVDSNYWKWRKSDGLFFGGGRWPRWRLDLDSVRPIGEDE